MKRKNCLFYSIIVICLILFVVKGEVRAEAMFEYKNLFTANPDAQSPYWYRIVSLLKTEAGTLLAFAECRWMDSDDTGNIDIVMRRSTNGGISWSAIQTVGNDGTNTVGNPTVLQDPYNNRIWLFACRNEGDATMAEILAGEAEPRQVWAYYSDNDGVTWSGPTNLSTSVQPNGTTWDAVGPGIGIVCSNGRLVIPANRRAIISDNHGVNWTYGSNSPTTNESQIVELSDGTLLRNDRPTGSYYCRLFSYSSNRGSSWSSPFVARTDLPDPQSEGSTISFDWNSTYMLAFSNPAQMTTPRRDLTIRYSYDDGDTWPDSRLITPESASYSCLTTVDSTHLGMIFEDWDDRLGDISFVKFRTEWILENTVFHWTFNELPTGAISAGSHVDDVIGYGLDGYLLTALQVYDYGNGKAVYFAGVSGQGIRITDAYSRDHLDIKADDDFMIRVVFRTNQHSSGGSGYAGALIAKDVGVAQASWWMRVQDGKIRFYIEDGYGNGRTLLGTTYVSDYAWHEVIFERDTGTDMLNLFVDGGLAEDSKVDPTVGDIASSNDVIVGAFNIGAYRFNGVISDIRVVKSMYFD